MTFHVGLMNCASILPNSDLRSRIINRRIPPHFPHAHFGNEDFDASPMSRSRGEANFLVSNQSRKTADRPAQSGYVVVGIRARYFASNADRAEAAFRIRTSIRSYFAENQRQALDWQKRTQLTSQRTISRYLKQSELLRNIASYNVEGLGASKAAAILGKSRSASFRGFTSLK